VRPTREVAVLVHREHEVLVLLRALGEVYWHVVAGGVEEGESYARAAERKLLEETGLEAPGRVHPLRHRYVYSLVELPHELRALYDPSAARVTVEAFATEAPAGWTPRLNEEHSEYRWCSFADAIEIVRWPEVKEALLLLDSRLPRGRRRRQLILKRPRLPATFFLRFASEESAEEVGEILRADGYDVTFDAEPAHWLLIARGQVREDSFDVAASALEALAEAKGGCYAGYRREGGV
jgi:dATP pyrophosphohydrolase